MLWRNQQRSATTLPPELRQLYSCDQAAATKHTDHPAETTQIYFLTDLEAGSPGARCGHLWFPVRPVYLACRPLPSAWVLTWSFFHVQREQALISFPLLAKTGPMRSCHPLTSLNLKDPLKAPPPNTLTFGGKGFCLLILGGVYSSVS